MQRLLRIMYAFLIIVTMPPQSAPAAEGVMQKGDFIFVEVDSHATIYDGAKNTARKAARDAAVKYALEKALGPYVGVSSRVRNSDLVDKLFVQAAGIVKDFKIKSEKVEDNTLYITASCKVSEVALDGALGPIMIDTLGNPRILILIDERVDGRSLFSSVTEEEILKVFQKAGYTIVKPPNADIETAKKSSDVNFLREVAGRFGADILVCGKAYASSFSSQKIEGINIYGVRSRVQLTAILNNTALSLGSDAVEKKTKGVSVEDGAIKGFRAASPAAARSIVYKIAYELSSGGTIPGRKTSVSISDISGRDAQAMRVLLQEADGVTSVYFRGYSGRTVAIDVVSDKPAEEVAELLMDNGVEVDTIAFDLVEGRWTRGE